MTIKLLVLLVATILGFSCNNKTGTEINTFKKTLLEKQLTHSSFYISIPSGYSIKENEGPDFTVYYFGSTDTTLNAEYGGGIYFGNYPAEFPPDNDSCTISTTKATFLGLPQDWTIYNCQGHYAIQLVSESRSGQDWNQLIHAFGHANSKRKLNRLLIIFSTLHKRKNSPRTNPLALAVKCV